MPRKGQPSARLACGPEDPEGFPEASSPGASSCFQPRFQTPGRGPAPPSSEVTLKHDGTPPYKDETADA